MIYPPHFPSDYENNAEKMVYQALTDLPEKDFDVFFHKTFSGNEKTESDDYEIDFLIVDKRDERFNAILIIEVKGGRVYYSGNDGCWYQNKHQLEMGPDDQARKNKYNFKKRFKTIISNIPIHWIVWFPEGIFSGGEKTPTNMNKWQIFDNNFLVGATAHIVSVFDRIRQKHDDLSGESLEDYSKRLKISLLRGLFIIQPLNILLKQYEERYFQLQQEQKTFFASLAQIKKLSVSGGAGTGKTMLASSAAMDFGNEGKNVLFLCFNRMLYRALDANISCKQITVSTFHTFAYDYVAKFDPSWLVKNPNRDNEFHMQQLPQKFRALLQKNNPKKYDVVIIDEAQDFEKSWLEMIFKFTSSKSNIILFFDENQNIFKREFLIPGQDQFFNFQLIHNYRNSQKICDFVQHHTGIAVKSGNTPQGVEVDLLNYTGLDDLVRQLKLTLLNLIQIEKIPLKDIVIIVDGHLADHPLAQVSKIDRFTLNAWDVNSERKPDELYFTSISRFKGLESNVVLLVLDEETQFLGNKQFYTQCTRAKSVLKVFWKEN